MTKVIFLKPYLVEKIWGAQHLQQFHYDVENKNIGEAWVISAIPNKSSYIVSSPFQGMNLFDFFKKYPEWFDNYKDASYPLLAKILDCNDDLSVQVHPTKAYQTKFNEATEKNEAWLILDAKEDSSIIYGHNAKTKDELINNIKSNDWNKLLRKVNVKPGDLFYVSAGTVHALGKGLVVYEIQQASDVTYRLFDYGRDRPLNVQEAIDNINIPFVKSDCHSHDNVLIDSKHFTLAYIKNHGWHNYRFLEARWLQVTVINGRGRINCFTKIKKGDNFILRSDVKNINIIGKVDLLISYIKK